jgi:intein/homing endonuclease
VTSPEGIARGREETVAKLGEIFDKPSNRCFDIVPRHRKMTEAQIDEMHDWLTNLTK